jgi:hypothetical protein
MNAKSTKRTLKAAALAAGVVALLLPMGCTAQASGGQVGMPSQPDLGSAGAVVAPLHIVV